MCSVLSVTMKSELLRDTIFWMNLHLTGEYTAIYIRRLSVYCYRGTAIALPSTPPASCTVTTIIIIIIIWSSELNLIVVGKQISTYSSKPSNIQWILFTGTSYTELIVVEVGPGPVPLLIIHSHLPCFMLKMVLNHSSS